MRKIIATSFAIALALAAAMTHAQQVRKYGTWTVDTSAPDVKTASTVNSAGATTGIMCFPSTATCDAYIALDINCEHGVVYRMMVNSEVGSYHLSTKCLDFGKTRLLVAEDSGPMMSAFESGGDIGFSLPVASSHFREIRFSTTGATAALKAVMQIPPQNNPRKNSSSRFDETL